MTERARREYVEALQARYAAAGKRTRGRMLDEYCRVTGCHRKAAIRRLAAQPGPARRRGGRPRRYGPELRAPLEQLWVASDRLCGKLLVPVLPALLAALERHHGLGLPAGVRASLPQNRLKRI